MLKSIRRSVFLLFIIFFSVHAYPQSPVSTTNIEYCGDGYGLFSNLTRIAEWIYCITQNANSNYRLRVNMNNACSYNGDVFSCLFKNIEDPDVFALPNDPCTRQCNRIPGQTPGIDFTSFATDGMRNYQHSKYLYMSVALYKDPDFQIFRNRMHPVLKTYFQPLPNIQSKIEKLIDQMEGRSKIGIHVRCIRHYLECSIPPDLFLDKVMADIDEIMSTKDPNTTTIFLATLFQPLVTHLSSKYHVVCSETLRTSNLYQDWDQFAPVTSDDMLIDALVDTWCLSLCDEMWGGSSNMTIWAGCLNPNLNIQLIPSLSQFDGS